MSSPGFASTGEDSSERGVGGGVEGEHIERAGVGVIEVGGVRAFDWRLRWLPVCFLVWGMVIGDSVGAWCI